MIAMAPAMTPTRTLARMRAMLRWLPAGQIGLLDICQLVDLDAERGELEARDLAVDRLRDGMDAGRERSAAQDELLDRQRVDGERDVHHCRRMPLTRCEVHDAAAGEQVEPAAGDGVLVDQREHGAPLLPQVGQR